MSARRASIAMFDSGLGGLTVYTALREALPNVDIAYAADTARLPYGDRPLEQVEQFARQMIARLQRYEPALLVIACGTTCSAFDRSGYKPQLPTIAIVDGGIAAAVAASPGKRIGVIATGATIGSGIFERKLKASEPATIVTSVAAPSLVPIVESGRWSTTQAKDAVDEYCSAFRSAACEVVILGCTHYPHLSPWFVRSLGEEVTLVDPARECARAAKAHVGNSTRDTGALLVEVSGDPLDFARRADELAGVRADAIERVDFSGQVE